jgi:hypothetical protein
MPTGSKFRAGCGRALARHLQRSFPMISTTDSTASSVTTVAESTLEARGEHVAQELDQKLKPVLVGVALAAGALAVVGGVALLTRRRRRSAWLPPAEPSALRTLARNAAFALLRVAAGHAVRALTERLAAPAPDRALAEPGPAQ